MRKLLVSALGAALAALLVGPVRAEKPPPPPQMLCLSFSSVSTAYDDCIGLNSGNTSVGGANAAFAGDPNYSVEYKDNQTGAGSDNALFDLLNNGNDSVTLKFLQNVGDGTTTSVIALKFGGQGDNQLGYFRFDLADFDVGEMLTFSWNPSFAGDGISHASLFTNDALVPREEIPEPATLGLMFAGFVALGFNSRRRREQ
jgi:PEP-CTERM motif-containing protein